MPDDLYAQGAENNAGNAWRDTAEDAVPGRGSHRKAALLMLGLTLGLLSLAGTARMRVRKRRGDMA